MFDINKFSLSPVVIETEQDLSDIITSYFVSCESQGLSPTFTDLAAILNISRHQLIDFPITHKFSPIVNKAKQFITAFAERQLFLPKQSTGVQFWLKNNDNWQDKSEVTVTKAKSMLDIINDIESENKEVVDGIIVTQEKETI